MLLRVLVLENAGRNGVCLDVILSLSIKEAHAAWLEFDIQPGNMGLFLSTFQDY